MSTVKNGLNQNKNSSFNNNESKNDKTSYGLDYVSEKIYKNESFTFSNYYVDLKDLISDKHDLK